LKPCNVISWFQAFAFKRGQLAYHYDAFSHPASISVRAAAAARAVSRENAKANNISTAFGDDMLLPWMQVAAVVLPRVGQVWTLSALVKVHGDTRLRRRGGGSQGGGGGGGGGGFISSGGKRAGGQGRDGAVHVESS
jgi:uncharacterized membrane protein YgcG